MTTEPLDTRKIRDRLDARRASLLARYHGTLDRSDEQLATPAHELVDVASSQWDAHVLSLMSDADAVTLENVVAAIQRLEAGSYGVCTVCGEPIEPARLHALPEAAECVDCVRFAEETPPRWIMSIDQGR